MRSPRHRCAAVALSLISWLFIAVGVPAGASSSSGTFDVDGPTSIAYAAGDIWVANTGALNAVSEFSATTGKLIRVIDAKKDKFNAPSSIVATAHHVWIASPGRTSKCSITELNASNGSLVRVTDARSDRMSYCTQIALSGNHLWVVGSHITELDASNGSLVRVITAVPDPNDLAIAGNDLWVTDLSTGQASVYELDASTGSVVRDIQERPDTYIFNDDEDGIAASNGNVWISNGVGANLEQVNSVVELSESDGSVVQILGGPVNHINGNLNGIESNDNSVWVLNADRVTELDAKSGAEIRSITSTHTAYTTWASGVAFDANDIWISNDSTGGPGSVSEFNVANGESIRSITDK